MYDYCNCCYKKVWVYSTIEIIYISVFLQINTMLKGLILNPYISHPEQPHPFRFDPVKSELEPGDFVFFK